MGAPDLHHLLQALSPEARAALDQALGRGLEPLQVHAPMSCSEWAERNFYLSAESSYEEKAWKAYPFQTAMLDAMGSDEIEEVDVIKSARVGYTKMALATLAYMAEHKRRNQVVYQPTDDDRDEFVTTELEPMLRDVRAMRRVFPRFNRKSKDNTLKVKRFLGCLLHLRGGKAAKNYRRLTVDVVVLDELSGFDADVEKEGSPDKLAFKRLEGAAFKKMISGSTPKLKGFCLIDQRHARAELRFKYHIRCPHCTEWHPLTWGGKDVAHGMRWVDNDPATVRHVCPHNGCMITQQDYAAVWADGRWIGQDGTWIAPGFKFITADGTERPAPRHIGFHVWTAYSPQASWADIVREFLAATEKAKRGDKSDLKTFVNTTLGETWEEEVEKTEASALARRAALDPMPYRQGQVPAGGLVLVAGVDVQADRWEVVVWAVGRGEEMWAVWYQVVHGNPADQREWDVKLAPVLGSTFQHRNGPWLQIKAAAVDTGGHYTHQAYVFTRNNPGRNWYAVKGDSKPGQPIKGRKSFVDVNDRGRTIKRGATLWAVGTDTAKDLLHGRFEVMTPGPGFVHFPTDMPPEFYTQLTSEARVPVRTARGDEYRWIKPNGARNEVLDCTVYAMFCVQALDLHRYSDQMWRRLESAVEPDLFDSPAPPADPDTAVVVRQADEDTPKPAPVSRVVYPTASSSAGIASSEWSAGL